MIAEARTKAEPPEGYGTLAYAVEEPFVALAEAWNRVTADCVTDYGPASGGAIHGRDEFLRRIQSSQARFKRTHHQLGQIQVDLRGRDATSIAYLTSIHITFDGRRIDGFLQYHDSWVKTSDGWKISARRGVAAVVDGDPSEDRLWVHRSGPRTDIQS